MVVLLGVPLLNLSFEPSFQFVLNTIAGLALVALFFLGSRNEKTDGTSI